MSSKICRQFKLRGCAPAQLCPSDECGSWIEFNGGTISSPGRYCLARNLSTTSTSPTAITIASDDVVLDMNTKTVTLRDASTDTGILANMVSNVTILNGVIETAGGAQNVVSGTSHNTGISLDRSSDVLIYQVRMFGLGAGILGTGVNGVVLKDLNLQFNTPAGGPLAEAAISFGAALPGDVNEVESVNILLDDIELYSSVDAFNRGGLTFGNSADVLQVKNIVLRDIRDYNVDVLFRNANNVQIHDSEFLVEDEAYQFSVIQFGAVTGDNINRADNVLVRNSSFINRGANTSGASGVSYIFGSNAKFDEVIVDVVTRADLLVGFDDPQGNPIPFTNLTDISTIDPLSGMQTSTFTVGVDNRFGVLFPDTIFNEQAFVLNLKVMNSTIRGDTLLPAFYASARDVTLPDGVTTAPFTNDAIWLKDSLVYDSTACIVTSAGVTRFGIYPQIAVLVASDLDASDTGTIHSLVDYSLVHGGRVEVGTNNTANANVVYDICPHGSVVQEIIIV